MKDSWVVSTGKGVGGFFLQTVKDSWPYLERGSLQREWDGRDLLEKGTI